ncbi:general secretion pathway protein H [Halopseudomonas litoralis]|uniref:Type II secretion system protein H n=1 Tax=Halopseudomonas litoralis TaxID=797277 RepID=A0A1H1Q6C1_9GAMM|nr:type II secretion system minor pseudopilin GspH [Halopseudomonas litoralis]SDS18853.1 general secretion pathway protein H [Halopseudomonas litoralis]
MTIQRRSRGFTLIELMIVLIIIGVATAAISLDIAPAPDENLRRDARELALRLTTAQNEVRIDGRVIAWQALGDGYQFVRGTWTNTLGSVVPVVSTAGELDRFDSDEALRPRQWRATQVAVSPETPLLLTSEWIGAPLKLELRSGEHQVAIVRDNTGNYRVE